MESVKVAQLS